MFPDSSKPSTEPRLNFVCEVLLHLIESNYAAAGNKLLYCVMGLIITPSKLLPHLPGADELIFAGLYVQGITFHAKNKKNVWVTVNADFRHSKGDSAMIFTGAFVTLENHVRIVSLVKKSGIYGNKWIILYVLWLISTKPKRVV